MQKQSLLIGLGLTVFTSLSSLVFSLSPSFSQTNSSPSQPKKVTFFCQPTFDRASKERIPTTVAWVPQRKGHVRFIIWKSEYFTQSGLTPEQRCQKVTQKFQEFYDQGRLNYLSLGKNNGYPIICGLTNQTEPCNGNNQLFTIKLTSNPQEVMARLMDIAEGKAADPLFQTSGGKVYIPLPKLFENSNIINAKK
jgi:hypothetical protein